MPRLKEQRLDRAVEARLAKAGIRLRRFLFTEAFEAWVKAELPKIHATTVWGQGVPARRQVASVINQFLRGDRLHIPSTLRCLHPHGAGVWEIKTGDARVFGWFAQLDVYVAASGGDAFTIKDDDLYAAKISEVIRARDAGAHDFIPGDDARRVISL